MAENFPNLRKETDIQVQEAQSPSSIFSDHNDMKLEINCKKRNDKKNGYMETKTTCQWVKDKIKEETKKYLETNDNENTPIQNLWNTAKAVRGKYIGIRAFLKKNEKNLNLTYYLKEFEKEQNLKTTEGKKLWRSERRQILHTLIKNMGSWSDRLGFKSPLCHLTTEACHSSSMFLQLMLEINT